jgi:hypothetical protein
VRWCDGTAIGEIGVADDRVGDGHAAPTRRSGFRVEPVARLTVWVLLTGCTNDLIFVRR